MQFEKMLRIPFEGKFFNSFYFILINVHFNLSIPYFTILSGELSPSCHYIGYNYTLRIFDAIVFLSTNLQTIVTYMYIFINNKQLDID